MACSYENSSSSIQRICDSGSEENQREVRDREERGLEGWEDLKLEKIDSEDEDWAVIN